MTIHVTLKGRQVIIIPKSRGMKHGRAQIDWKMTDDSDKFDFAHPPITFDDPNAPMSGATPNGGTATCTDDNKNDSGADITYSYHVHLIGPDGPVTYPPKKNPKTNGNPAIRNKPK